jgi:hypothetical protein
VDVDPWPRLNRLVVKRMVATEELVRKWLRDFLKGKLGAEGFTEKDIKERDLKGALHCFTIFRIVRGNETILIRLGDGFLGVYYIGRGVEQGKRELLEDLGLIIEETEDFFTAYYKRMIRALNIDDLEHALTLLLEGVSNET